MTVNGDLKLSGYPSEIEIRYAQTESATVHPNLYASVDISDKTQVNDYVNLYILSDTEYIYVTHTLPAETSISQSTPSPSTESLQSSTLTSSRAEPGST